MPYLPTEKELAEEIERQKQFFNSNYTLDKRPLLYFRKQNTKYS